MLTFMVTVKCSSNQMNIMNSIIFSFKITLLLTVHLAKIRFYRLITGNRPFTDQKVQKGLYYRPRSVNTDPLGNPVVPEVYRFHRFYWFQFLKVLLLKY